MAPNYFYLVLTLSLSVFKQSDTVKFSHVSCDEKTNEESPTDEILIEEASLHVAIMQMVGTVHIICF